MRMFNDAEKAVMHRMRLRKEVDRLLSDFDRLPLGEIYNRLQELKEII